MAVHCARVRFTLGAVRESNFEDAVLVIANSNQRHVTLEASPPARIKDSERLALVARPYATESEAIEGGRRWRQAAAAIFSATAPGLVPEDIRDVRQSDACVAEPLRRNPP